MATCDMCGNEYLNAFTLTTARGEQGTFDSFECAAHAFAPRCGHCGCMVLGHGVETDRGTYCCSHCARSSEDAAAGMTDRA